jgi:uncharacterized protein YjbI with pentapeptide repeats
VSQRRVYALCVGTFLIGVIVSALVSNKAAQAAPQMAPLANPHPPFMCPGCLIEGNGGDAHWFEGKDFRKAYLIGMHASNAVLDGSDFSGADLANWRAFSTSAKHTRFVGSFSDRAGFRFDDFTQANFTSATLTNGFYQDSTFAGANFTGANLSKTGIVKINFTGANFTNANLSGMQNLPPGGNIFTGAIWANTTCPDGTNSDAHGHTCIGHF